MSNNFPEAGHEYRARQNSEDSDTMMNSDQGVDFPSSDVSSNPVSSNFNVEMPTASTDSGIGSAMSSDPNTSMARIVNHRVSNVSTLLQVASALSFMGTALFTKRCRLSDNDDAPSKRTVLTQKDYGQIQTYTVVGTNLVEDPAGERYQLVILTTNELALYNDLKTRIANAIEAGLDKSMALGACILHPGAELIRFNDYDIYVQREHWGTLHNYLIKSGNITEERCKELFRQMVDVVDFMHKLGAVMRDISLRRWIFAEQRKKKLILGTFVDMVLMENLQNDIQTERFGCPSNMAPEMVTRDINEWAGRPADMFSLGISLFVMATRRFPFYDGTAQGLFRKIRHCKYEFPHGQYPALTVQVKEMIRDLLQKDPSQRPTANQLLRRTWFRNQ